MRLRTLPVIAGLIALAACTQARSTSSSSSPARTLSASPELGAPTAQLPRGTLSIRPAAGQPQLQLQVQIAETPAARETGLMGVTQLADGEGMAFLFGATTTSAFWMKDTLIPLDIAFWDASGTIISLSTMQPCTADPCHYYNASGPYVGAVEMKAGLLERSGIKAGDLLSLVR